MLSPHILHIIYGNIVAFLASYLYKFSWGVLRERKGLHLAFGVISVGIFFSLPFVFMTAAQVYMTPGTWKLEMGFWDGLFRADVFFRLAHFFLASFAVTGIFMMLYGTSKKRVPADAGAGEVLVKTGASWFVVTTGLNVFVGLLTFFQFPAYGIEAFYSSGYHFALALGVLTALGAAVLVGRQFLGEAPSRRTNRAVVTLVGITIVSMATARHGLRLALLSPAMTQMHEKTEKYLVRVKAAKDEAAQAALLAKRLPAAGASGEALAGKYGCLACHSLKTKIVGPAYKDVAAKGYSVEEIVQLIHSPKPEHWPGYGAMPPMTTVPDEDGRVLARWINAAKE
jgi:cytochrome c